MTILVATTNILKLTNEGIISDAPKWVRDCFEEMTVKLGQTPSEAINSLRRSPFFDEEWILN